MKARTHKKSGKIKTDLDHSLCRLLFWKETAQAYLHRFVNETLLNSGPRKQTQRPLC